MNKVTTLPPPLPAIHHKEPSIFDNDFLGVPVSILPFASILTWIIGDSITAAYMMDTVGTDKELNRTAQRIFEESGVLGLITLKLVYFAIILGLIYIMAKKNTNSNTFKGFFWFTTITGLFASIANIIATSQYKSIQNIEENE